MSEINHVKVSNENTLTLPTLISEIFKSKKIPEELDIIIIDKKPQDKLKKPWDALILMMKSLTMSIN
jgi:hypothetical protein